MSSERAEIPTDGEDPERGELATESIVVKIRWFGVAMGYGLVQTRTGLHDPWAVRAFLALGAGWAALETWFQHLGDGVLGRVPLFVSVMESIFIGLLCYHDTGLDSPFRWYYLLSIICAAIRYRPAVAWATCAFHGVSLLMLGLVLGGPKSSEPGWLLSVLLTAWVTWACVALADLLKSAGRRLERLNGDLQRNRAELERRVAERTDALRASQARLIQQEKMAAFGLIAAGIAHEVGNPLAALGTLVQMLQRRGPDPYTAEKLQLASNQIDRLHRTVRELIDFSRPASSAETLVRPADVVDDALGIAKYYPRTKQRTIVSRVSADVPAVRGVRDHLTQVVLNLVLNGVDATETGGRVTVDAEVGENALRLSVRDDGRGIGVADRCRLFQPFFTTKPHGTGLGLFVSRQVVAEMGGRLTYRTGLGEGSTFTVELPIAEAPRVKGANLPIISEAADVEGVAT
jgi:signal transduction histidine kinase